MPGQPGPSGRQAKTSRPPSGAGGLGVPSQSPLEHTECQLELILRHRRRSDGAIRASIYFSPLRGPSIQLCFAPAKLHVEKSKAGQYTKPWSTPKLREAIEKRNALRRTVADKRAEYLEACAATRNLSEESRQKKWEEFLADLENNPDLARTWKTIKSLSGTPSSTTFAEPLLHKGRTFTTNRGKANAFMKE